MNKVFSSLVAGAMLLASFAPLASARTPWASWHRNLGSSSSMSSESSMMSSAAVSSANIGHPMMKRNIVTGESSRKLLRKMKVNIKKFLTPDGKHKL